MEFLKGVYYGILQWDPYSIIFAIFIFILILAMAKFMFNLVIVILLACVVLIGVFEYSPQDIYYQAESVIKKAALSAVKAVDPVLADNLKNADIIHHKDGSFEVSISDIKITGKKGENEILLYFKEEKFALSIDSFSDEVNGVLTEISEGNNPSLETDK